MTARTFHLLVLIAGIVILTDSFYRAIFRMDSTRRRMHQHGYSDETP